MNPATIRQRHAVHTLDRVRDRAAAAAVAHTRAAAAVADHRTAAADRHPIAAVEVHRRMVAVAAIAIRNRLPATASVRQVSRRKAERATENQPSLTLRLRDETLTCGYQTPLSLPVILNATAAAEASGGSRLKRNVAGTLPLKAAWVICFV